MTPRIFWVQGGHEAVFHEDVDVNHVVTAMLNEDGQQTASHLRLTRDGSTEGEP